MTGKSRHHFYIDDTIMREIEVLAAKPGGSKSAIVAHALRALLDGRGADQVDAILKGRLTTVSAHLTRLDRNQQIILESLALFIRYQLTITAPVPKADKAARAVGQDRFQAFV